MEELKIMATSVAVAANGRMVLPAAARKRLGLAKGGAVLIEETDDGLVLRTVEQAIARAQAWSRTMTEGRDDATVDHFLAERKLDWPE